MTTDLTRLLMGDPHSPLWYDGESDPRYSGTLTVAFKIKPRRIRHR